MHDLSQQCAALVVQQIMGKLYLPHTLSAHVLQKWDLKKVLTRTCSLSPDLCIRQGEVKLSFAWTSQPNCTCVTHTN